MEPMTRTFTTETFDEEMAVHDRADRGEFRICSMAFGKTPAVRHWMVYEPEPSLLPETKVLPIGERF